MAEEFADLALFPEQLVGMSEVLVLAATATAEERAAGRLCARGRRQHRDEVGLGEILVIAEHPHADAFAGQRERDHNYPLGLGFPGQSDPAQAGAEVGERGDLKLELGMVREGVGR